MGWHGVVKDLFPEFARDSQLRNIVGEPDRDDMVTSEDSHTTAAVFDGARSDALRVLHLPVWQTNPLLEWPQVVDVDMAPQPSVKIVRTPEADECAVLVGAILDTPAIV
ncbi:hypothetical protein ACFQJ5_15400 [Halomicroarcula sp. GCM10025324]|uniref:hypothetical protein n=1 Tax=Haloarcula TaxID=2237 RepID=UPI0023E793DA|nr:hypothetical protein [Halomicroarcula sp. ZS-22-S1]